MIDLGGRVALVTGASAGIGGQIARAFGAAGAAVVVHARREDARVGDVMAAIAAAGGRAVLATGDLADEAACAEVVEQAVRTFGRLDVLFLPLCFFTMLALGLVMNVSVRRFAY